MESYQIKLTINGLYGEFAEKYACLIKDAHVLNRYFEESGSKASEGPIRLLRREGKPARYEPTALFARLMRLLRRVSLEHAQRRFYTGVRFEPVLGAPSPWQGVMSGVDAQGDFAIEAFGLRASLLRAGVLAQDLSLLDVPQWEIEGGRYVVRWDSLKNLFKEDLVALITVCEESMAKGEDLLATVLPA